MQLMDEQSRALLLNPFAPIKRFCGALFGSMRIVLGTVML
jgi:hypothetical protein